MPALLTHRAQPENSPSRPDAAIRKLVEALRCARCYPHPADDVEVVETHISYVLLAGAFAYKIKKPVSLEFLDFSTLDARLRYCREELRLNRRAAPDLYLDVVPIVGRHDAPAVDATGVPIEYAVKMRRFPQEALLDRLALRGILRPGQVDALAAAVARLHLGARRALPDTSYGSADQVLSDAFGNLRAIDAIPRPLRDWTLAEHHALRSTFESRRVAGFVRECHGDLHLGNVVWMDEAPVIFDCIEFNPEFRWIDVMSDVAFVVMDLHHGGYPDLAARFLDAYLQHTGDYAGLRVLRFYLVYRALVRAKIACIRASQPAIGERECANARVAAAAYLQLAARLSKAPPCALVVMHGLSGSGKTTVSQALLETYGAIRVRSDVERKRLLGMDASAKSNSKLGNGLYAAAETERTYAQLATIADAILDAGYPAIVDATFLARPERSRMRELAAAHGVPFAIADCVAPVEVLLRRIDARNASGRDASEASASVLDLQRATAEPLDDGERAVTIAFETDSGAPALEAAIESLARRLDFAVKGIPCVTTTSSTAMPTASARSTR